MGVPRLNVHVEYRLLLVFGNSDSRIDYANFQFAVFSASFFECDFYFNAPFGREFYGVSDKVEKYLPQAEIRARFPDAEGFYVSLTEEGAPEDYEDTLTYRASGAGEISGWQIHLALTPRQEHLQMGEEAASAQEAKTLHLFYENGN